MVDKNETKPGGTPNQRWDFSPLMRDKAVKAWSNVSPGKRDRSNRKPQVPRTPRRGEDEATVENPTADQIISNFDKKILLSEDSKNHLNNM